MYLKNLWDYLESNVFPFESRENLWNPYRGENLDFDRPSAAQMRRENLKGYLACFKKPPKSILVGEAPGPWGCRFSGLAFTSERQLSMQELPIQGKATSTFDGPAAERSGSIVWNALKSYFPDFFLWNCVPYHPHHLNEPLSIRTPTKSEIIEFSPHLGVLLEILNPEMIFAVGRKAEMALTLLGHTSIYLRHPSFGGKSKFLQGLSVFTGS